MNLVMLHSAFTVFLFFVFIAILVWACQKRQQERFESAAMLALASAYELETPKEVRR